MTPDPFEEADRANERAKIRNDLERERWRRDAAKGNAPAGDLPLFDDVRRQSRELF